VLNIFKALIEWVKLEPLKSGLVIILAYIILIIFSLPIVFLSIPLGFAFHSAFEGSFGKYFK
jgi:hypothetical protein